MKKLVLLALIGGIMFSCKNEPVKDYLVLSGDIQNYKKRDIKLESFRSEEKIKFDRKANKFSDTLKIDKNGFYTITFNKRKFNLYLSPTEDLKIIMDYKNPDSIKFEGKNALINDYFVKKAKVFKDEIGNLRDLLSLEEEEFLEKIGDYKNSLTDLALDSELPESFLKKEIKNIDYEYRRDLNYYPAYYPVLSGEKDFVVSENFPDVIAQTSLNNGNDYTDFEYYRTILVDNLKKKVNEKTTEEDNFYLTYLETIQTEISDTLIKNDLLFHETGKNGITYADDLDEYYRKFMAYSSNNAHKSRITEIYNSLKLTAKGNPSPKFNNYENYEGGSTSLDDLTGHGKYLYIDVWATWCGFCKRETPLLKRLEQQYHDKDIEFVSISVDNVNLKDKWKETIAQKEMGGVQLFADKSFGSDFIKKFAIKGLPRFILVDPEGNIVSPNAPRPSDGEKLTNLFADLGI